MSVTARALTPEGGNWSGTRSRPSARRRRRRRPRSPASCGRLPQVNPTRLRPGSCPFERSPRRSRSPIKRSGIGLIEAGYRPNDGGAAVRAEFRARFSLRPPHFRDLASNVGIHIQNAYARASWRRGQLRRNPSWVRSVGGRQVHRRVQDCNLDVVISVGHTWKSMTLGSILAGSRVALVGALHRAYTCDQG
jgi:hypothetical protein